MKTDATSLDRLHDIVLPPPVSWWPLAPGWYVIFVLLGLAVAWGAWRYWKQWRADQYRREALRQLTQLQNAPSIAELLRRTALAVMPRSEIAAKTGAAWPDWLDEQNSETMPAEVRQMLISGIYSHTYTDKEVNLLRNYTARWISSHNLLHRRTKGQ